MQFNISFSLDASREFSEVAVPPVLTRCSYASCYSNEHCETGRPAFKRVRPQRKSMAPCFCDDICLLYGDCCYDFFSTCLGFKLTDYKMIIDQRTRIYTKYQESVNLEYLMKYIKCLSVTKDTKEQYIMVSGCPSEKSKDLIAKCQNQSLSDFGPIPVSLVAFPFLTFRNIFCALCHGFERNDVQFWNVSAVCPKTMDLSVINETSLILLSQMCFIDTKPRSYVTPRACDSLVNVPPYSMFPEDNPCPFYQYVVKDKTNLLHKNPHCAKLTLGIDDDGFDNLDCVWSRLSTNHSYSGSITSRNFTWTEIPGPHNPSKNHMGAGYGVGSLNILFQFTDRGLSLVTDSHHHRVVYRVEYCSTDQVYDFYIDRCKNLTCPHHRKPVNGSCVLRDLQVMGHAREVNTENDTYMVIINSLVKEDFNSSNDEMKLKSSVMNDVTYCFEGTKNMSVLDAAIYNFEECFLRNSTEAFPKHIFKYPNNTIQFVLNFKIQRLSLENLLFGAIDCICNESMYSTDLISLQQFFIFNTNREICSTCKNNSVVTYTEISISNNQKNLNHHILHSLLEYGSLGIFRSMENTIWLAACDDKLAGDNTLHCTRGSLSYSSTEYTIVNQTATLKESGKSYRPGSYVMKDSFVIVCNFEFVSQHRTNYTGTFFCYDNTQEVIAIVTSSASMLSLVTVLIVYWLLPSLRTQSAGQITMSLSGTMLLAQGLLVVVKLPRDFHVICVVTAALTHWAWLSTFVWMTVLSVDLTRVIRGALPPNPRITTKPFFWYALVAWVIPFIFVTTSVLVDLLDLPNLYIGYGGPNSCWIANTDAVIALFGVPASITLVFNIGCFVLTFAAIQSTTRALNELKSRSRSNRRKLGVYIRLVFIMGFTWIFSFVAALWKVKILAYSHLVFNGIQGFYIFLAFVAKKRVAYLLFNLWSKRRLLENPSTVAHNLVTK